MDMVRKAIRAGVPALVSKTMPTVQSLELAAEYGLQFVCGRKHPLTLKRTYKINSYKTKNAYWFALTYFRPE